MALSNTYLVGFDDVRKHIVQMSKDGANAYRSFDYNDISSLVTKPTNINGVKFDEHSNQLIVCTNSGPQVWNVSDNDFTLVFEIESGYIGVNQIIRDKNTGKWYTSEYGWIKEYSATGEFIQEVYYTKSAKIYSWYMHLDIDYTNNLLVIFTGTTNTTSATVYEYESFPESTIMLDSFTLTYGQNFYDYNDYYYNHFYPYYSASPTLNYRNLIKFNKFDGNMYRFMDGYINYSNTPSCYISAPGKMDVMKRIPLSVGYPSKDEWTTNGNGHTQSNYIYSVWQGRHSGNWYILTAELIMVFDVTMNPVKTIIRDDVRNPEWYVHRTRTQEYFAFNPVTEEISVYRNDTDYQYLDTFDRNLEFVSTNQHDRAASNEITSGPFEVITGAIEEGSVETESSTIVYPVNESLETNLNPTVVFAVGTNPEGWTQQFRLVADRDLAKIEAGTAVTTYERAYDSWTSGSFSGEQFKYSEDYTTNTDPDANGTWTILGTSDGLQEGGTHIVNGIDGREGTFFVKMTIPSGDELEGVASNDVWYFKVFSYSKFTG